MSSEVPSARRTVRVLVATTFLQWVGASAMLPLLPLFLRHHGGSDAVVGAVMAAFFVAGLVVQYPAGTVADRIGKGPVLLAGLGLYAISTAAFALPVGPVGDIGLRFLEGAGSAAVSVSALALIAERVPLAQRGRAVGSVYGAQLAGLAVGPLVGSLIGLGHMDVIFIGAAAATTGACGPALGILATVPRRGASGDAAADGDGDDGRQRRPRGTRRLTDDPSVRGALVAAAALGLVIGVYEACWTLLLDHRGAHDWQIGLSWTLFAVPFVVMSRPAGWLADHFDRRRLVVCSLVSSIAFCCSYPFLPSLFALLALGAVEAVGFSLALPAMQSMLTQQVPADEHGRAQGLFGTSETGAIAVSASAGGALFAVAPWAPFLAGGLSALALTIVARATWSGSPGRVASVTGTDPGPGRGPVVGPAAGTPATVGPGKRRIEP